MALVAFNIVELSIVYAYTGLFLTSFTWLIFRPRKCTVEWRRYLTIGIRVTRPVSVIVDTVIVYNGDYAVDLSLISKSSQFEFGSKVDWTLLASLFPWVRLRPVLRNEAPIIDLKAACAYTLINLVISFSWKKSLTAYQCSKKLHCWNSDPIANLSTQNGPRIAGTVVFILLSDVTWSTSAWSLLEWKSLHCISKLLPISCH